MTLDEKDAIGSVRAQIISIECLIEAVADRMGADREKDALRGIERLCEALAEQLHSITR